jgi:hypothetical protein
VEDEEAAVREVARVLEEGSAMMRRWYVGNMLSVS